MQCNLLSSEEEQGLTREIQDYMISSKYKGKITEAKSGCKDSSLAAHHRAVKKFLYEKVIREDMTVLELGCAAGVMLLCVQKSPFNISSLVGVELVYGWVDWAKTYYSGIDIYQGDVTNFVLPPPHAGRTFDLVMLNDVAEHIQQNRYGCLFGNLKKVTHEQSLVYFHTPTPQAQIVDSDQYYENVLPTNFLVMGMALAGFELVLFEHDFDTRCGGKGPNVKELKFLAGTKCGMNGWPKYYHAVFRRTSQKVFDLA